MQIVKGAARCSLALQILSEKSLQMEKKEEEEEKWKQITLECMISERKVHRFCVCGMQIHSLSF